MYSIHLWQNHLEFLELNVINVSLHECPSFACHFECYLLNWPMWELNCLRFVPCKKWLPFFWEHSLHTHTVRCQIRGCNWNSTACYVYLFFFLACNSVFTAYVFFYTAKIHVIAIFIKLSFFHSSSQFHICMMRENQNEQFFCCRRTEAAIKHSLTLTHYRNDSVSQIACNCEIKSTTTFRFIFFFGFLPKCIKCAS